MVKINFVSNNKSVIVEKGTTILEAARKIGVIIESPCNAVGVCGKCKVKVVSNNLKSIIQDGVHHLSEEEKAKGFVLSCQAKVMADVDVEVKIKNSNKTLKILNYGESFHIQLDNYISKQYRDDEKTYVYAGEQLIGKEEGNTTALNYGIVVDIGTTTLVASLVNINSGEEIYSVSALNPQSIHAQDVLSRIKFASDEKGLDIMCNGIIEELNSLVAEITNQTGIDKKNIYEAIFSGNTCMIYLASRVNPYSLGKYPYDTVIKGGSYLSAKDHNFNISEIGIIYLPPIISAYVGPDITSGVLASRLQDRKGITLFVDIGTNGEMVIGRDGKLSATSTAAGPAFEGMNIAYGMRAQRGAIEYFNIEEDGSIEIETIENQKAIGICGSGLLDIVGELVSNNVIGKNGKFSCCENTDINEALRKRLVKLGGKIAFEISEGVFLTQKDIRQVQLAKGAVRSGIEFLMKNKEVHAKDVDTIKIAGAFGYHLRAKSLINIGLLPKEFEGKIEFVGNTSKSGGHAFLANKKYRQEMEQLVKEIEVVELSKGKDFDKIFVECLSF